MIDPVDNQETDEEEETPVDAKELVEILTISLKQLGFDAEWVSAFLGSQGRWNFWNRLVFFGFLVLIGLGLFLLVAWGTMDSTTFGTLLAVLVGAALTLSIQRQWRP
jgi:hypothetical protein